MSEMSAVPEGWLTYTCFDDGQGLGGWRVKQEIGSPATVAQLHGGMRAALRTDLPLPAFPTKRERHDLPRRLVHTPALDGRSLLWHTIAAGKDPTGRPGNTFLTAAALSADDVRRRAPIDFWRSPSWPTPFGPHEVVDARLTEGAALAVGDVPSPERIVRFLFPEYPAPMKRGLLLEVLGAVDAAVTDERSRRVAVLVDDGDEAAMWIAVICAWTTPAWAQRFAWSTWERAEDLKNPGVSGLHLVCLPASDGDAVRVDGQRTVFHPRRDAEASELRHADDAHREALGSGAALTRWPAAVARWLDPESAPEMIKAVRSTIGWPFPGQDPSEPIVAVGDLKTRNLDPESQNAAAYTQVVMDSREWLTANSAPMAMPLADDDPAREPLGRATVEHLRAIDAAMESESTDEPALALRMLDFAFRSNLKVDPGPLPNLRLALGSPRHAPRIVTDCGPLQSQATIEYLVNLLGLEQGSDAPGEVYLWLNWTQPTPTADVVTSPRASTDLAPASMSAGRQEPARLPRPDPGAPRQSDRRLEDAELPSTGEAFDPSTRVTRTEWLYSVRSVAIDVLVGPQPKQAVQRHFDIAGINAALPYLSSPLFSDESVRRGLAMLTLARLGPPASWNLGQGGAQGPAPDPAAAVAEAWQLVEAAAILHGDTGVELSRQLVREYQLEILTAMLRLEDVRDFEGRQSMLTKVEKVAEDAGKSLDPEDVHRYLESRNLSIDFPNTEVRCWFARGRQAREHLGGIDDGD